MSYEFVQINGRLIGLLLLPFALAADDKIGRQSSRGSLVNTTGVRENRWSDIIVSRCYGASSLT